MRRIRALAGAILAMAAVTATVGAAAQSPTTASPAAARPAVVANPAHTAGPPSAAALAQTGPEAYLFAHMTDARYGVLHYAVSLDGLHWTKLNGGKAVNEEYHGHPSIAQGPDGRFYLVGNKSDDDPDIRFWVSDDLIKWQVFGTYRPDLSKVAGLPNAMQRIGAPKLYFDKPSNQFVVLWHTATVPGVPEDPERYWSSQRTLYALSPDLKRFDAPPKRLFKWEIATIDTFLIANPEGGYCAVIKDERYPSYIWTTGKTIRMTCAKDLLGPYPEPGPALSPAFREAPTLVRAPNGVDWLLYYEQYAGNGYGLSMAPRLEGPWVEVWGNSRRKEWDRFEMPAQLRHGSMMPITKAQYEALRKAYPER
ncbi:hypothetical protein [Roseateles sp. L2-2]|uniref:hypothetical protein n=1 Tax=Roseateles TaxID=93681 RepID=UPI003D360DF6